MKIQLSFYPEIKLSINRGNHLSVEFEEWVKEKGQDISPLKSIASLRSMEITDINIIIELTFEVRSNKLIRRSFENYLPPVGLHTKDFKENDSADQLVNDLYYLYDTGRILPTMGSVAENLLIKEKEAKVRAPANRLTETL